MSLITNKRISLSHPIEDELELSEPIIQHIQSFMEVNTAAQTSLLSKSWYNAWSTRPVLVLDDSYFRYSRLSMYLPSTKFWEFANKTVQRYIDQNRRVDKFLLRVDINNDDVVSLLDEFITDASKLRVGIEIHLAIYYMHVLPAQVLEQRYVTELSFFECKIIRGLAERVLWPNLVSLTLCDTYIRDHILMYILSSCRLIEYLKLTTSIVGLETVNLSGMPNLKTVIVESFSNQKILVEFGKCSFLHMNRLILKNVKIKGDFFIKFASKFPCLEDLTLGKFDDGITNIRISSESVKFLNISLKTVKKPQLDVPNIRKFKFSGPDIPTISFAATTKKWESEIEIRSCVDRTARSLEKFRKLLIDLRESKISLNIVFTSGEIECCSMRNIECIPVVETLTVSLNPTGGYDFFAPIGGLLWSCNPKFVNLCYNGDMKVVRCLYEKLVRKANQNCYNLTPGDLRSFHDLKEVSVEFFKESAMEWQPVKALRDTSEILHYGPEQLRFKLTWLSVTPALTVVNFVKDTKL